MAFWTPRWLKRARELEQAVRRFLRYENDRIAPESLELIEAELTALRQARQSRDQSAIQRSSHQLTELCDGVNPYQGDSPGWRENVEMVFVYLVIALAIKGFLLQPFMIPTGSMQPTLNGVKLSEVPYEQAKNWNLFEALAQRVLQGRVLVEKTLDEPKVLTSVRERTRLRFFTATQLGFRDGSTISIALPKATLMSGFGLGQRLQQQQRENTGLANAWNGKSLLSPVALPAGFELARGVRSMGDQLFVNRIAYHFRAPRRGEVFVFTTRDIPKLREEAMRHNVDSMHYIKRLVGMPEDTLQISQSVPELMINGQRAPEPGIARVGSKAQVAEGRYSGYLLPQQSPDQQAYSSWPIVEEPLSARRERSQTMRLGKGEYAALGDNSASSLDSRYWGPVREGNLVGPAWFSYWPFHSHFGPID